MHNDIGKTVKWEKSHDSFGAAVDKFCSLSGEE
jgi:hypothetical protein